MRDVIASEKKNGDCESRVGKMGRKIVDDVEDPRKQMDLAGQFLFQEVQYSDNIVFPRKMKFARASGVSFCC